MDFTPFTRSAIGFDALFDRLNERMGENTEAYPPYDIIRKGDDEFQINLALAGFSPDEITVTTEASQLLISGRKTEQQAPDYLYQGISAKAFERRFSLADYIEVESAAFENGLLHINLVRRVPDRMKPRRIDIGNVAKLDSKGTGKAA
jgi:molecular chaperone IbpA